MLKALMPVLSALAGEELKFVAGQTKRAAIFGAAIAIFAIIAITFFCVAAFLALAQNYGGPLAALILAALSLIVALLILAVLKIQAASEAKSASRKSRRKNRQWWRRRQSRRYLQSSSVPYLLLPCRLQALLWSRCFQTRKSALRKADHITP